MNDRRPAPSQRKLRSIACGLATLAALCCVGAGCSPSSQSPEVASESPPSDRVEIALVDRVAFDAVLAGLRGKVVLVDCWATWCGPCVEQLPHSVALAKGHRGQRLAVVTLNFDDPDATEQVSKILGGAGAVSSGALSSGIVNLQSKLGGSSESMDDFEIASGALPHYKLYDRQGKLRDTFELDPLAQVQFTPADIDSAVAKLLAE